MLAYLHPCKFFSLANSSISVNDSSFRNPNLYTAISRIPKSPLSRLSSYTSLSLSGSCLNTFLHTNFSISRSTHVIFCSKKDIVDEFTNTYNEDEIEKPEEVEELELRVKPSPKLNFNNGSVAEEETESKKINEEEALEPFLRFFRPTEEELNAQSNDSAVSFTEVQSNGKVNVEYYNPKPGDFVVGVVVSGNENKLDVNIGADLLGTMLTKEILPLYDKEIDYLMCDREKDADEFMVKGKMGIVKNTVAMSGQSAPGRPVVEPGTVVFAEVLGRTLSGRPLLSTRKYFRRLAWHRVRQIKQLNEPVEVKITEWNTSGLVTRIEGLRGFLPKAELINRVNTFTELKENVGRRLFVKISQIKESTNALILSEKEAWTLMYLTEGTVLEGTVQKIYPFGAQVRIGESNRSGLLHISNISKGRVASVSDLLAVNEKVKVLVIKSMIPDKISFSTAELESEPGLFISNKQKVFSEAEEMGRKYRKKMPLKSVAMPESESLPKVDFSYEDEPNLYANWNWFIFERDNQPD